MIPSQWTTRRLIISDSRAYDIGPLGTIRHSCSTAGLFDPRFKIATVAGIGDLIFGKPPNPADKNVFRIQTVRDQEIGGKTVGSIQLLHDRPKRGTVILYHFEIEAKWWRRGYGREVFEGLLIELGKCGGYSQLWVETYRRSPTTNLFFEKLGRGKPVEQRQHSDFYQWRIVPPPPPPETEVALAAEADAVRED
jgi:hypothetical protein